MARIKIKMNRAGIRELMRTDLTSARAEAVAASCNAESDGLEYRTEDASSNIRNRTVVYTIGDDDHNNRMIRNLGAGS